MLLIKASKSRKKFLHKKRARKTFFETLLHAKIWFFLKNFGKIFLKIAADPDLSPELPPIKPEEITFSFSRCSGSRKIFFSLLRVFFKKNIFFKKNFQFFQFLQKWDFEIFCEKYFSKIIFSFFRTFRAPLLRRLFLFLQNCTRKNIFLLFFEKYFWKNFVFFSLFLSSEKSTFQKKSFFHKNTKICTVSKRDFQNCKKISFLKKIFISERFWKIIFFARKNFFVIFVRKKIHQMRVLGLFFKTENRTG